MKHSSGGSFNIKSMEKQRERERERKRHTKKERNGSQEKVRRNEFPEAKGERTGMNVNFNLIVFLYYRFSSEYFCIFPT